MRRTHGGIVTTGAPTRRDVSGRLGAATDTTDGATETATEVADTEGAGGPQQLPTAKRPQRLEKSGR